ncbi:hypothetical protein H5410_030514, partial [Solanum commersonii]
TVKGDKLSLEQLTPNQMGSSRTPTCHMKSSLRLSPLTLSISKQAKVAESIRPKSNFLELKPFESSNSSKTYLEVYIKNSILENLILNYNSSMTNHLVSLVEIADQLGDPPFSRLHRRLSPFVNIVVFGSLGDIVQLRGIAR